MATNERIGEKSEKSRKMCCLASVSVGQTVLLSAIFMCLIPVTLTHKNVVEMKLGASQPLSLHWGIGDAVAYVGKLFTYQLPDDAFKGTVVHYKITEAGKESLPSWLTFNTLKAELKGIPDKQNIGTIYIEVNAIGDDNSKAADVFAISILEDTFGSLASLPSHAKSGPQSVKCRRDDPQTIVTVIVDCDCETMLPSNKIGLLEDMVSHLNLAPEMCKMMPVGEKPMFDSNALVAGPGNIKQPQHAGTLISWLVGCGKVEKDHMPILQLLETSAHNGDMSGALGYGIIGWHVTNTRFSEKVRRKRAVTPTPTLTVPPPTSIVESSTKESSSIQSTSTYIAPTQIIDIQPTKVVTSSSASSSSVAIQPTETLKMTKTEEPSTTTTSTKAAITSSTIPTTTTTSTTTKATTAKPTTQPPKIVTPEPECPPARLPKKAPRLSRPVRNITLDSGIIKKIKIPEDTFFSCYDDATSDLMLDIRKKDGSKLPSNFWLKVIKRPSRPYNILLNPLNTNAGSYTFKLTATNFYDMSTSQDFVIEVHGEEMSDTPPTHELSMSIDADYDEFMSDIENRVELSNKVASLYGDKNSKFLTVTKLEKGSVVYAWTNNSLSGSGCPVDKLNNVVGKLVDENGNLTPEVQDAMQPYKINSIASAPLGSCTDNPNFPTRTARRVPLTTQKTTTKPTKKTDMSTAGPDVTVKPDKTTPTMEDKTTAAVAAAGAGGGSDMWITTVVPAIVVVIVLIIALVIACCLYRKKRQGRMKLQEKDPFAQNKGVPVIFADEYEEKPNDSTRPLIMEDEKPPMPPPEYPRASSETSGNSNSTQPVEDKDIEEIEMEDTDITSPLYSPPPPLTASNNSKPPHVQSSMGPPPYVPP